MARQLLLVDLVCFKEAAGIVCHAFEALSRGCVLLDLEMISFLSIINFFL